MSSPTAKRGQTIRAARALRRFGFSAFSSGSADNDDDGDIRLVVVPTAEGPAIAEKASDELIIIIIIIVPARSIWEQLERNIAVAFAFGLALAL
mmetsp:Transcript_35592/g.84990  ORF Transcript_35592/g.84990 Transcript_35592/m.84990 type:complete len:94 (+) Transcript_35592:391-672(+)